MVLEVKGSDSNGNCYLLKNNDEILILESGINPKEFIYDIDFENIKGVLITHEHLDHARYVNFWLQQGIDVYMSKGTKEKLNIHSPFLHTIESFKTFKIGGFRIKAFDIEHDAVEPYGFLINHSDMGNLLFATDTYYLKYKFDNLNHILIECNYQEKYIKNDWEIRLLKSHMELQSTISTLKANDLSNVYNIVLLHLSHQRINEKEVIKSITNEIGIKPQIASRSMLINL